MHQLYDNSCDPYNNSYNNDTQSNGKLELGIDQNKVTNRVSGYNTYGITDQFFTPHVRNQ